MAGNTHLRKRLASARHLEQQLTAVGETDWVCLTGDVALQVTGAATAVTVQLQRSTKDPTVAANPVTVDEVVTGNPSTGIKPVAYLEPGVAWWRGKVTALIGASVQISICGTAGEA